MNIPLANLMMCSQGHLVHNWKVRWFVLMPDQLQYYKYEGGKRDSSQRGKILLKGSVLTCPYLEYEHRPVSSVRQSSTVLIKGSNVIQCLREIQ